MENIEISQKQLEIPCPARVLVNSSSSGGKTSYILRLCQQWDNIFDKSINNIIIVYSIYQPKLYDEFKKLGKNAIFMQGFNSDLLLKKIEQFKHAHSVIFFDDVAEILFNSPEFVKYMTTYSHHLNASIIISSQHCFLGKYSRIIQLQITVFIILYGARNYVTLRSLAQDVLGAGQSHWLKKIYEDACDGPFKTLILVLSPKVEPYLRIRGSLFPEDLRTVYIIPK